MSYDFRKVYQVAEEAGCEISSDNTIEAHTARIKKVKEWIDKKFSDIFETGEVITDKSSASLKIYFRGTNSGIFINAHTNGALYGRGYVKDDTQVAGVSGGSSGNLHGNSLKLLVIKSKYGFIAGFFKENISDNIKALVINMKDRFVTMIYDSETKLYVADGTHGAITSSVMKCSLADEVCLSKLYPPGLDCVPEGVYQSVCSSSANCMEFSVGDKPEKYVELPSKDGYITFALKLEEPTEDDYSGIKAAHGSEA